MEIQFEITPPDVSESLVYYHFKTQLPPRLLISAISPFFIANFGHKHNDATQIITNYAIGFFIAILLLVMLPYIVAVIETRQALKYKRTSSNNIVIMHEGLSITTQAENINIKWQAIKWTSITPRYIYIFIQQQGLCIIPRRYFALQKDGVNFYDAIVTNLEKVLGKPKIPKQYYKWGWLGFIPNVGAIMGIILIIRSTFQFRDLRLFLIGAADVLFTILFWWGITIYEERSDAYLELNKSLILTELNQAVASIEFYKLNNGFYPDSLPAIKIGPGQRLYDVFAKKDGRYQNLIYHKIAGKYTIFSVGPDGKPNTADDIYPSLIIADSSKIGLIKRP